jgi:hypothetical protein
MTSTGRVARLTALALATGTLVAAGSASAATTTTTDKIQALGKGQVVHVRIALPAALPVVGQIIDQWISTTDGTVTTVNNLGAKSVGKIGEGAVPVLSDVLKGTALADLDGKQADSVSLIDVDKLAGILSAKVLAAKSNVANPTKDGVLSHSESTIAGVTVDALALPALSAAAAPAVTALENVVDTAQQTSNAATGTVTGVLSGVTQQLDDAANTATTPAVTTAIETAKSALDQLLKAIQLQASDLENNPALVDLGIMKSNQTISRVGHQVTSTVSNELAGVSLLGGLVTVDALKSKASATAGGKAGTAAVIHEPGVLTVHVADLLTLKIGKTIELTGTLGDALPADLKASVNDALATVLDLLRQNLGLEFLPGDSSQNISADGTSAASAVSAAKLILSPPAIQSLLPAGEKLITVEMVGAQAAVGAQVINLHTRTADQVSASTLPRTGGNMPLTGAAAVGLVGLAMVARRRRLAHIAE